MAQIAKWGETLAVKLDVGFITDAFELDSSTLNGPDLLNGTTEFVDITEYVQGININRGRNTQLDTFNPGSLTITADDRASSRSFDPLNTASPWYQGTLGIAPRRAVEIYGGSAGTAAMFKGYVYDLNIEYDEPNLSTATILAVDALAQLSQTNLAAFNPSQELTSDRVSTILNRGEVAWSTALRNIGTGIATCGTIAYEDNTNTLQALQAVQLAENGRLFANRNGLIEFDPRVSVSFGTAIATLGGTATTAIPIEALQTVYGAETVLNRISVQITGGTASSVANGTASQTEYGIKNFSLTDVPLVNDAAGSALAANLLTTYQTPEVNFTEVGILVNRLTQAQQNQVANFEIGDILEVVKTFTTGTPTSVTQSVVIESIRRQISPSRHQVVLSLGKIDLLLPFILNTSNLNDATYGLT
jgi:hypothetical protein